jgi:SHS2 domain-containing protein
MGHHWVDHTAELELRLDAATEAGVFEDALAAVHELLNDGSGREEVLYDLEIEAADRATLLATWLDELLFRAETEDLVPQDVERLALEPDALRATVRARRGAPRHLVKGVTYHRLAFEPLDGGYRATVVLDV